MMTNTRNSRARSFDFIDNSYPSERTMLEMDVFHLEALIDEYLERRNSQELEYFGYVSDDDREEFMAVSAELSAKRARLASMAQ